MSYYLAKLCYEIICGDGSHTPQFEEQIRLLESVSRQEALVAAKEIGYQELLVWQYGNNTRVEWKFLGITELIRLPALAHGAELYQSHREIEYADGYRNFVKDKTNQLQQFPEHAIDSI
jgi:hypothetical protein